MTYSRDFCSRSHGRYTQCANHSQDHGKSDWRDCPECVNEISKDANYL